jgi:hypothetical protein
VPAEANVDPGLLIAQTSHGPGMHGGILVTAVVAIALVVAVVALIRKGRSEARAGSDRDHESDPGPGS